MGARSMFTRDMRVAGMGATVVGTSWMATITTAPQISPANPRRQS